MIAPSSLDLTASSPCRPNTLEQPRPTRTVTHVRRRRDTLTCASSRARSAAPRSTASVQIILSSSSHTSGQHPYTSGQTPFVLVIVSIGQYVLCYTDTLTCASSRAQSATPSSTTRRPRPPPHRPDHPPEQSVNIRHSPSVLVIVYTTTQTASTLSSTRALLWTTPPRSSPAPPVARRHRHHQHEHQSSPHRSFCCTTTRGRLHYSHHGP